MDFTLTHPPLTVEDSSSIDFTITNQTLTGSVLPAGVDHGSLAGLTDDDHTQYLLADGTRALTGGWDAGSFEIRAQTFESDVATGTAPFVIASTTKVTNLNADLLDDQTGSYYLDSDNFTGTEWTDLTDTGATTLHKHDHGGLDGLSDDDHTQYALLLGRSGGQTLIGGTASGDNLTLQSTSNATKGKIIFGTSAYDEVNNRLGIGNSAPTKALDVTGSVGVSSSLTVGSAISTQGVYSFYQRELSTALNTLQIAFTRSAGTTQFGAVSMIALMSGRVTTTTYQGAVLINIQSRFSAVMISSTSDLMAGITVTKTVDTQTALTLTLDLGITGSGFTELTCQIFPIGNTNANLTMTPTVITV